MLAAEYLKDVAPLPDQGRRVKVLEVSQELMPFLFRVDGTQRMIRMIGMPADVVFEAATYDPFRSPTIFRFLVRSASFEPVPAGREYPLMTVQIEDLEESQSDRGVEQLQSAAEAMVAGWNREIGAVMDQGEVGIPGVRGPCGGPAGEPGPAGGDVGPDGNRVMLTGIDFGAKEPKFSWRWRNSRLEKGRGAIGVPTLEPGSRESIDSPRCRPEPKYVKGQFVRWQNARAGGEGTIVDVEYVGADYVPGFVADPVSGFRYEVSSSDRQHDIVSEEVITEACPVRHALVTGLDIEVKALLAGRHDDLGTSEGIEEVRVAVPADLVPSGTPIKAVKKIDPFHANQRDW